MLEPDIELAIAVAGVLVIVVEGAVDAEAASLAEVAINTPEEISHHGLAHDVQRVGAEDAVNLSLGQGPGGGDIQANGRRDVIAALQGDSLLERRDKSRLIAGAPSEMGQVSRKEHRMLACAATYL